jgi:hypothetical protein
MAKTKSITIRAGRTIPHPTRSYANISTNVELAVELDDGDDPRSVIDATRIQAEQIVHTHQEQVLHSIRTGETLQSTSSKIAALEAELELLRKNQAAHSQGLLFGSTEIQDHGDNYND